MALTGTCNNAGHNDGNAAPGVGSPGTGTPGAGPPGTGGTFYVTTPIYYPSEDLHIGNTYTTVVTDTVARYKRLRGYDVRFLTGTDEHGVKIWQNAMKHGVTPIEYVDPIVGRIKKLWELYEISGYNYIRTTEGRHIDGVRRIFQKLYDSGDIYKGEYEGWYCVPCEAYYTEAQLTAAGMCPDCEREVKLTKEECYYFRLSKYQGRLVKHIEENPGFIQPVSRRNEMLNNFLLPGLEDLCVSRATLDWGVGVPFDERHVVYVWVDALTNYVTALGYGLTGGGDALYQKYWPADIHFVGKDIIRFHTIIWPAILMALGEPLPKQVYGHGFFTVDGVKMSKSRGNVVDPVRLAGQFGTDAVRYYLLRDIPFGLDGDFTYTALINRTNSDLANDLGNLLNRTVAMAAKYFGGAVPAFAAPPDEACDTELIGLAASTCARVEENLEKLQFNSALAELFKLVSRTNKYIDETTAWVLARDESKRDRLAQVMYNLLESIRIVGILLQPFMTRAPSQIFKQIGLGEGTLTEWDSAKRWGAYPAGAAVEPGPVIFPRIDAEKMMAEIKGSACE